MTVSRTFKPHEVTASFRKAELMRWQMEAKYFEQEAERLALLKELEGYIAMFDEPTKIDVGTSMQWQRDA